MTFLGVLVFTCLVVWATAPFVANHPKVLYGASAILVAVSWAILGGDSAGWLERVLILLIRRCYLPLAVFYAVMFIGVFDERSELRRRLQPVRAAWSIVGCVLVAGHLLTYLALYLPRLADAAGLRFGVVAVVALGIVLTVLVLLLGITSAKAVKRRMAAARWRAVQRWSYVFWAAAYGHLLMVLLPSALAGSSAAISNLNCYTAAFLVYLVMRVRRAVVDSGADSGDASLAPEPHW